MSSGYSLDSGSSIFYCRQLSGLVFVSFASASLLVLIWAVLRGVVLRLRGGRFIRFTVACRRQNSLHILILWAIVYCIVIVSLASASKLVLLWTALLVVVHNGCPAAPYFRSRGQAPGTQNSLKHKFVASLVQTRPLRLLGFWCAAFSTHRLLGGRLSRMLLPDGDRTLCNISVCQAVLGDCTARR